MYFMYYVLVCLCPANKTFFFEVLKIAAVTQIEVAWLLGLGIL